jgi:exoribonuclease II
MLDHSSLAQLAQLKKDILATKDYAEGTVVGARGSFGFVKLDDGRTVFLNPERMKRVLPGDRVKVNVVTNDKDQLEAELEQLLEQGTRQFVGQYHIKGANHFVELDDVSGRWLFVPPPMRKKCGSSDFVLAELLQHPYTDGKASVKIVARLGAPGDDFIYQNVAIANFGLHRYWSKDVTAQVDEILKTNHIDKLADFTHLPLVTIDAPTTRDMDDAIYADRQADHWVLWVAIADPGHHIFPGTHLAKAARGYGQTVYLPGRVLPMLPEQLSTQFLSLLPDQIRSALIAQIKINDQGEILQADFQFGKIKSRHKLNYQDVAQFLDKYKQALSELPNDIKESLQQAYALAKARTQYRQTHNLTYEDQPDYDFIVNAKGLLEDIQKRERNAGHKLVEEAMLCTNIAAGDFLAQHKTGIFNTHLGFREERIGEVRATLREDLGQQFNSEHINQLSGHLDLIRLLQNHPTHSALLSPFKRMMQNSEINTQPDPHFGLGLKHYATVTSPIRRYVDLCNHWSIMQILAHKTPQQMPLKVLEELRETLQKGRQANRQLEQTLAALYLNDKIGLTGQGIIRVVTQQGFGVKLIDTGFEGFVQIPKHIEKIFDAKRMTLKVGDRVFALDTSLEVKLTGVDIPKRRIQMEPIEGFSETNAAKTEPTSKEVEPSVD